MFTVHGLVFDLCFVGFVRCPVARPRLGTIPLVERTVSPALPFRYRQHSEQDRLSHHFGRLGHGYPGEPQRCLHHRSTDNLLPITPGTFQPSVLTIPQPAKVISMWQSLYRERLWRSRAVVVSPNQDVSDREHKQRHTIHLPHGQPLSWKLLAVQPAEAYVPRLPQPSSEFFDIRQCGR